MRASSFANKKTCDVCKKSIQEETSERHQKSRTHSINTHQKVLCEVSRFVRTTKTRKAHLHCHECVKKHTLKFLKKKSERET